QLAADPAEAPSLEAAATPASIAALSAGALAFHRPSLAAREAALAELLTCQQSFLESVQHERAHLADCSGLQEMECRLEQVREYQQRLARLRKEMHRQAERLQRLKKRAIQLQQAKQTELLKRQAERERELEAERQLIARPAEPPPAAQAAKPSGSS
ncbi:hypothetical protein BOX15_Mlig020879g1, partial [Macrostomum lignano]